MADAPKIEWPPGAREAVRNAISRVEIDGDTWPSDAYTDAALAALAPFVAAMKRQEFQRGAEVMREAAGIAKARADMHSTDDGFPNALSDEAADCAAAILAAIPENKP